MEFNHELYGLLTILMVLGGFGGLIALIHYTETPADRILKAVKERGPSETITIHGDGTTTVKKHKCIIPVDDFLYCTGCDGTWQDADLARDHDCPCEA